MTERSEQNRLRRRKRRIRRAVAVAGFVLLTTGLAWFFESQATTTVIVTRYAETLVNGTDPGLSPQGGRRARELMRVVGDVDVVAGVDAIFVTTMRRSRDTGLPVSVKNEAPVLTVENPADVETLVNRILQDYKGDIVLVITDPEHIQPLIAEMQGSKKLPQMAQNEHDNLYIVSIPWFGKVKTLRLRYGDRYLPGD